MKQTIYRQAICLLVCLCLWGCATTGWAQTIKFCEAPTVLPRNTQLPNYSPVLCFEYSGLPTGTYTLRAWLLETQTGSFLKASNQWEARAFTINNSSGANGSGSITVVEPMDVFDYSGFRWVIRLFNQAGVEIAPFAGTPSLLPDARQCSIRLAIKPE